MSIRILDKQSWNEWYEWIEGDQMMTCLSTEGLESVWDDLPELVPVPLIDERHYVKGHKMLIAGPSVKQENHLLQIELCIAIAEGQ